MSEAKKKTLPELVNPISMRRKRAGVILSGVLAVFFSVSGYEGRFSPASFLFAGDQPCPSNPEGQKNLRLSDVPAQILPYLNKHNIPTKEAAFCRFLENLQQMHKARIEEGFLDMAGDYFMTSQSEETRIYLGLKYAYPDKAADKEKLATAPSKEKMAEDFLAAVERDADKNRQKTLNEYIDSIASKEKVGRKEAAIRMVDLIFEKSWDYQTFTRDLLRESGDLDSSYAFVNRGLRTTTNFSFGLTFYDFVSSEEARKVLPHKIQKVLIIGPGLQFINFEFGNACPEQIYEPFGIMDSLISAGLSEASNLEVDAFDINERVINHLKTAVQSGKPYDLYKMAVRADLDKDSNLLKYFSNYGDGLPGVEYLDAPQNWKPLYPYGPDSLAINHISIPAEIVGKIHPIGGDIATTSLGKSQYDLIVSFNILVYLNETERVLAGTNIQRALKDEGVFITDNGFESDTGRRVGQKATHASQPLFDDSFIKLAVQKNVRGKEVFVYRRGSK
jgi:hypothetical protein